MLISKSCVVSKFCVVSNFVIKFCFMFVYNKFCVVSNFVIRFCFMFVSKFVCKLMCLIVRKFCVNFNFNNKFFRGDTFMTGGIEIYNPPGYNISN